MKQGVRLVLSVTVLLAGLLGLQFRSHGEAVPIRKSLEGFPRVIGDWQGRETSLLEVEVLNILQVKDYLMRRYVDPSGRGIWVYIGYWDTQRSNAQMHNPKNCLPGAGWEPVEASIVAIPLPGAAEPLKLNRYLVQKDAHQELVYYWYRAQGESVASEVVAKFTMMKNAISRNRTDGALIRLSTPVYKNVNAAADALTAYVQAMHPILSEYLPD